MRAPADRVVTILEDKIEAAPIQRQFIQSFCFKYLVVRSARSLPRLPVDVRESFVDEEKRILISFFVLCFGLSCCSAVFQFSRL